MQIYARFQNYINTSDYLCLIDIHKNPQVSHTQLTCHGIDVVYPKYSPLVMDGDFADDGSFIVSSIRVDTSSSALSQFIVDCKYPQLGIVKSRKIVRAFLNDQNNVDTDAMGGNDETLQKSYRQAYIALKSLFLINEFCEKVPYVPQRIASELISCFGDHAIIKLLSDPYTNGFNFGLELKICDRIASENGISFDCDSRYRSIAKKSVQLIEKSGSTCADIETIISIALGLHRNSLFADMPINQEYLKVIIVSLPMLVPFQLDNKQVLAFSESLEKEKMIASRLKALNTKPLKRFVPSELDGAYDDGQQAAIIGCSVSNGIRVITGGPGTGKTTTIKKVVQTLENNGMSVVLCAPTGRAAARISESSGYTALTIHKLLGIKLKGEDANVPDYDHNNPLPYNAVIVDEMSMPGIGIFSQLLDALTENTLLILVGDPDQLESVEAGNILADILKSQTIPVYRLTHVHRQASGNSIIDNAHHILDGNTNLTCDDSFDIKTFETDNDLQDKLFEMFGKEYDTENPYHLQALTPMRKSNMGIEELNYHITQKVINKNHSGKRNARFHLNDKVMTVRNSYKEDCLYMNGDIWLIESISNTGVILRSALPGASENKMPHLAANGDMELAYVSTIHKSQGSEYDHVIIILSGNTPVSMLNRNLLYTAVTRAKSKVTILTSGQALNLCILNKQKRTRKTLLSELLKILAKKDHA